jgi:hypothetical protein
MAKEVRIRVRGVLRAEPDLRRLARALLHEAACEQRSRQDADEKHSAVAGTSPTEAAS